MAKNTKKTAKIVIAVLIVIAILFGAFYVYNLAKKDINGSSDAGSEYTLVIESSDFEYQVAKKLSNNKIVVDDTLWTYWMDKNYPDFSYTNGEYYLNSTMSYEEIAKKLQNPDISHKTVSVCIPEGYNVFDIAALLEKDNICSKEDFYAAVSTTEPYNYDWLADFPKSSNVGYRLEGFLFPATYDFGENTDAETVVDKMLGTFDNHITDSMEKYCKDNNMSLYEFITLASVVQEEAFDNESAKNIASALINRLNKGSKLQCDVTYYYAKNLLDNGFSQDVYNEYYTYRCDGLPEGPIANCGEDVISAVINHPKTDYLYFFSDLNKEFHFASTAEEFERQKEKYPWK